MGPGQRRRCNRKPTLPHPRQLARMTRDELFRGGLMEPFLRACAAFGQPWFEHSRAAENEEFSAYVGVRLGWETETAMAALPKQATTLMGRVSLQVQAANDGPFASNASRVLRGEAPVLKQSGWRQGGAMTVRLGDRRRNCGQRRRPGTRSHRRGATRAGPDDGPADKRPTSPSASASLAGRRHT